MKREISLFGEINEALSLEVKSLLASFDPADELVVRIDSPGGSVFHGFAVFEALRKHPGPKRAVIESAAFSIASYIAMAFDEVEIAPNGYMMIHNPSAISRGDDEQMTKDAALLTKLKNSMVEMYAKRTGMPEDAIRQMLKDETYLDAKECVERGFATRVSACKVGSRIKTESTSILPFQVAASLFGASDGGTNPPPGNQMTTNNVTPVAASVKDIRASFPKMSDSFVLSCIERNLPMAQVAEQAVVEQQKLIDEQQAEILKLQAEIAAVGEAKAQADSKAKAEADAEAAARAAAAGNNPVGRTDESGTPTALARWNDAFADARKRGLSNLDAAVEVNRRNPGLREKMLAEVNG